VNLERVELREEVPSAVPAFIEGRFNSSVFELARSTEFGELSRAWQLTEVILLLDHNVMFDTDKGVRWVAYPRVGIVRVYLGRGDYEEWDSDLAPAEGHLLEVPFGLWYEHVRYAAGLEMEALFLCGE
jgi:hypothetical protein